MQISLAGATLALASCLGQWTCTSKRNYRFIDPSNIHALPFHSIHLAFMVKYLIVLLLRSLYFQMHKGIIHLKRHSIHRNAHTLQIVSASVQNCSSALLFHLQAFCRNQGDTTDNVCARTSRGILAFWWCQVLQHIAEQSVK